jgi:hypothetical protein
VDATPWQQLACGPDYGHIESSPWSLVRFGARLPIRWGIPANYLLKQHRGEHVTPTHLMTWYVGLKLLGMTARDSRLRPDLSTGHGGLTGQDRPLVRRLISVFSYGFTLCLKISGPITIKTAGCGGIHPLKRRATDDARRLNE